MVFFILEQTQIKVIFKALNTVSLSSAMSGGVSLSQDIRDILLKLNIDEDAVSLAQFTCITRALTKTDPMIGLTAGIKPEFLQAITEALGFASQSLNVTSLRFGTTCPIRDKNGMELVLQPLLSDPNKSFQVIIVYQTDNMAEFGDFIKNFGEDVIKSIVEAMKCPV